MTADQVIRMADQHHRSGRPAEARKICRELLAREPNHPEALHLLGILTAQAGQLDAAVELIGRALRIKPDFPQAWANLGCTLVNQRKLTEAIAAYHRLTELKPRDAGAHHALGILLRDSGRLDEAIAAFSTTSLLKPKDPEPFIELGKALRSRGRLDEAIAALSTAVKLKPDSADAFNSLGNALRDKGLIDQAIARYTRSIQLKDDDPVTHFNLGNALNNQERFVDAISAYENALRLKPDYLEAHNQLGFALASLRRFDEALASHHRALALNPADPRAHEALGATLLLKLDMPGAEACFRQAMSLGPESAEVWNGLGSALKCLGRFDEAATCFRKASAMNPDTALFYRGLVSTGRHAADPAEFDRLNKLLDRPDLPVDDRIAASFVLGQLLDEADRFDEAFARFDQANSLFKQSRAAAGERVDPDVLRRFVDHLIENFTPDFFASNQHWGDPTELPVFIVGMPRSGTTLIEQIAASHPSVHGAGELSEIERISATLRTDQDRTPPQIWTAESIANASRAYLTFIRSLAGDASRVIDKMPGNVFHLGLVAVLFPRARIIFARRNPRDTCLSCYFQQFTKNNLLYTYDLADCARQYLQTERLTSHWLKTLPLRMLEVQYEDLITDQEARSRRLIDFLGLPWDARCLDFHKTRRTVTTASVWQVRQPIYHRSVGRWRNYQPHLRPLLDALAPLPHPSQSKS